MTSVLSSNKRIVKNTVFLYIRMLVMMLITLYTSRVVLRDLGVNDFGIYNVVGGIIVVFSFLSGPLTTACQRFINYEMGKSNYEGVKRVFSSSMVALFILLLVVVFLGETIGLWFLNYKMNIPEGRIDAANWVYQISILTFIVNSLSIPYNAIIIAHEKMSAFAYIGILEAALKFCVAVSLKYSVFDRLVYYAVLLMIVSLVIRLVYGGYCVRHFEESRFNVGCVNKKDLKGLFDFSKWTILGGVRLVLHTQGISIIVNMFFGVAVNAAQGIANQVNSVVFQFVHNFLIAMSPQIVQSYSAGNMDRMHFLVKNGCKLAVFMVAIMIIPLIIETEMVLSLWLAKIPDYAVMFVRMVLVITLIESFATVLQVANNATGNIKYYQMSLALVGLLHLPLTWFFFKLGCNVYYSMYVYVFLAIVLQLIRVGFVSKGVGIHFVEFFRSVILRGGTFVLVAFLMPLLLRFYMEDGALRFFIVCVVSFVWTCLTFFLLAIDSLERKTIISYLRKKIGHG